MPTITAFRDPVEAPIRKLRVDLIKTYKHINEVRAYIYIFLFLLLNHIDIHIPYSIFRSA